jgi:pyrroloquinoline quinone (PQQ) biosynthesis protein C
MDSPLQQTPPDPGVLGGHRDLDVEPSGAERVILERLTEDDPEAATAATAEAMDAWWGFLDSVDPD